MEYGTAISYDIDYSTHFIKNIGFDHSTLKESKDCMTLIDFFSKQNVDELSTKITQLLSNEDCKKRPIIVPHKTIYAVMVDVHENFIPEIGDIHSRFHINIDDPVSHLTKLNNKVIDIIVTDVKSNMGIERINSKLNIWTSVLDDFQGSGIKRYDDKVKIRENGPQRMMFHMRY